MKIKPKKIPLIKRDNINVAPRRIIVGYNLYKVVTFYVKLYDIFFSLNMVISVQLKDTGRGLGS